MPSTDGRPKIAVGSYDNIYTAKLPDGRWEARALWRDTTGKRRRTQRVRGTRAAAHAALQEYLEANAPRTSASIGGVIETTSVPAACEAWLEWQAANAPERKRLSARSVEIYKANLKKHVTSQWENLEAAELTSGALEEWFQTMHEATGIWRTSRALLANVFSWLHVYGVVESNPVAPTSQPPKAPMKPRRFPTPDETAAVVEAVHAYVEGDWNHLQPPHSPWLLPFTQLLRYTGLRRGEVVTIRWDDIETDDGRTLLQVHRLKKRTPYTEKIVLPQPLVESLWAWRRTVQLQSPYVFPKATEPGSHMFEDTGGATLRKVLKWALDVEASGSHVSAELRDRLPKQIGPHDFRRSLATALRDAGFMDAATEALAHADESTTVQHYLDPSQTHDTAGAILTALGEEKTTS